MKDVAWSRTAQAHGVRDQIWKFVSPASERAEVVAPLAASLLQLPRGDAAYLSALHMAVSSEAGHLLESAPGLLRHLTTSTTTPLEQRPDRLRGPVDWPATLSASMAQGRRYAFATRPSERDFDTPENRLLVWSLRSVSRLVSTIGWGPSADPVGRLVAGRGDEAARLLGGSLTRNVIRDPTPGDIRRLERGRAARRFASVSNYYRLHDRLLRLEDRALLRQMVERAALLTTSDGVLLELLVLFRTVEHLAQCGWVGGRLRIVDGQVRLRYRRDLDQLDLLYQAAPDALPNRYGQVLSDHGVPKSSLRPDLILDLTTSSGARHVAVVEVKYRRRAADAIRAAALNLMAYRDNYRTVGPRLTYLGVGWGADVAPAGAGDILLCTPDRWPSALDQWETTTAV